MPDQIAESVKADRVRRLIALGDGLAADYRRGFLGRTVPGRVEEPDHDGGMAGYTPEYIHVRVPGGKSGSIVSVRLTALTEEGMTGEIV